MGSFRIILGFVILVLLLLVFQTSLLGLLLPNSFMPNLLLVLVLYLALYDGGSRGLILSFLVGIVLDLSTAILLGPWAGTCVVLYCALSLASDRIFVESSPAISVIAFAASLISELLYFLLSILSTEAFVSSWFTLFSRAFITAIFAPVCFSLFRQGLGLRRGKLI